MLLEQPTMDRIVSGAMKGGLNGLLLGLALGAAGNFVAPPTDYASVLTWDNRYGKKTRFTNLDTASILIDDLVKIHGAREHNVDAYNEAFRNLQSVITLYHGVTVDKEKQDIMLPKRMTNYTIRASKAMEAVYLSTLSTDPILAADVERAMMNIQLSLEEFINCAREKTKDVLPKV